MRTKRYIWFGISILVGLMLGLSLGWAIKPLRYENLSPSAIGHDYKADYVLMIAEYYRSNGDLDLAMAQLKEVEPDDRPLRAVQIAILDASSLGYDLADMETLNFLLQAVEEEQ